MNSRRAGLSNLAVVSLEHNHVSGKIPAFSASGTPGLVDLILGYNLLFGNIPCSLGSLSTLELLDLERMLLLLLLLLVMMKIDVRVVCSCSRALLCR